MKDCAAKVGDAALNMCCSCLELPYVQVSASTEHYGAIGPGVLVATELEDVHGDSGIPDEAYEASLEQALEEALCN